MSLTSVLQTKVPQLSNYVGAQNALLVQFQKRFLPENEADFTQEEIDNIMLSIGENSQVIKQLITQHLTPIFEKVQEENTKARKVFQETLTVFELSKQQHVNAGAKNTGEKKKTTRRLSAWQIYLTYASTLIPGYKDSTRKIGLCKEHYDLLSAQERNDLCEKYAKEHPEAPLASSKGQKGSAKPRGGSSGYSIFSKQWYEEQKKLHPENRGLQAKACGQAWKALSEDERTAFNNYAKELKE